MGSGKGAVRRSQTVKLRPNAHAGENDPAWKFPGVVGYEPDKWTEFVSGGVLGPVRVDKYYLGRIPRPKKNGDYEKIIAELFADAISVGAVVLPSPYVAEDFEFIVNRDPGKNNVWQKAKI